MKVCQIVKRRAIGGWWLGGDSDCGDYGKMPKAERVQMPRLSDSSPMALRP
jgi:hypothetical protein